MYEKQIEALRAIPRSHLSAHEHWAVREAIRLMRAAEPKDEAAERSHCFLVAQQTLGHNWTEGNLVGHLAERFERERAAVRAECAAASATTDESPSSGGS